MITEDYVSFETAKLLKEKGFDSECDYLYVNRDIVQARGSKCNWNKGETLFADYECSAPTLQMAMKWLRGVYGLFIRVTEDITGNVFEWSVYQKNYGCKASTYVEDSYEKACEAAIKYCLEKLI